MDIIKGLMDIKAIQVNIDTPFVWASGIRAPIYCDNRKAIGHYELRHAIALQLTDMIRKAFPTVALIGGTATAGIPHATSVADLMKLPMIYIRSTAKGHGTTSAIEGDFEKGTSVVIIEDLISTGGSSLNCVEQVRSAGLEVLGVAAIFDYQLVDAAANFARAGVPLHTLTNFTELEKKLQLSAAQSEILKKWRTNPHDDSIWG